MGSWLFLVLGILLVLVGGVWILQGLNLLGQQGGMNGQPIWAVIGAIVIIIGLFVLWRGLRRRGA